MIEIKVTVDAPALADAINRLAAAIEGPKRNFTVSAPPTQTIQPTQPTQPIQSTQPTQPTQTTQTTQTIQSTQPIHSSVPTAAISHIPTAAPAAPSTVTPAVAVGAVNTVPTAVPHYTLDDLAVAGTALVDAGKMDQLVQMLGRYGVASLNELSPDVYGAVAMDLRALGAAI